MFANTWAAWQQQMQQVNAIKAEEAKVGGKRQQEAVATQQRRLAAEQAKVYEKLPGWKDPKVAQKASAAIAKTMKAVGFEDNDIAIHDHRALIIADKAAKYDALMAKLPDLRRRAAVVPVVTPGKGAPSQGSGARAASKRLNETGSVKDAASLFETFI